MSSSTGPPILELAVLTPGIPRADFVLGLDAVRAKIHKVPGVLRSAYAFEHETSTNVRLFIKWASDQDHDAFRDSDAYKPFLLQLSELLGGPPTVVFANLRPLGLPAANPESSGSGDDDAILQSGKYTTTEVVTIFFPLDVSSEAQELCERNMGQFMRTMKGSHLDGLTGIVHGWVLHDSTAPKGKTTCKAYIMLFGWTAIERHTDFTKGDVFKKIWPLYEEVYDKGHALEMEMYHVRDLNIVEGELSRSASAV